MNTIPCPDLAEAIACFTEKLGFRLDMIMPADSPRVAVVSRDGMELRLEQVGDGRPPGSTPKTPQLTVCRENDRQWIVGRAGMEYRDLIPDRLGGRLVASHIRLTRGGEVPDYVHYHKIGFQMIFCKAGRIRVVYQDQGDPFWLEPGDCVLQPPEIRHRVLEAEAGSEVIEISSPAEHETWVDHEMTLSTNGVRPNIEYGGQRFVRHVTKYADEIVIPECGIKRADTGVGDATGGLIDAWVERVNKESAAKPRRLSISDRPYFLFVLEGRMMIETEEGNNHELTYNDSVFLSSSVTINPYICEKATYLIVQMPAFA